MSNILIINGPNLNMLGKREPDIYGYDTLDDIYKQCQDFAMQIGFAIDFKQSNIEGEIINWIQHSERYEGIIINAAGFTHTSVAIMDALKMAGKPCVEVHLTNIYKREEFRHKSYISLVADGVISGFGSNGYILALMALKQLIE